MVIECTFLLSCLCGGTGGYAYTGCFIEFTRLSRFLHNSEHLPWIHVHFPGNEFRPVVIVYVIPVKILTLIEQIMEPETAGDPMGKSLNWTRKSTYSLSKNLIDNGVNICPNTAGKFETKTPYEFKPWSDGWGSDFLLIVVKEEAPYDFSKFNN